MRELEVTSSRVEASLIVMKNDLPPAENNFTKKVNKWAQTECTTTLREDTHVTQVVSVPRWVLCLPVALFPPSVDASACLPRRAVFVPYQHGHHVLWRQGSVGHYLERSISWLRFFYFTTTRRDLLVGGEAHAWARLTVLQGHQQDLVLRWHLPRTFAVSFSE